MTSVAITGDRIATRLLEIPGFSDRLIAMAHLAATVHHPNVIAVDGLSTGDGELRLLTERAAGDSLSAIAPPGTRLPPATALAIITGILAALQAAHEQGVVHGDVNRAAVLVTPGGGVKLGGLATSFALAATPGVPPSIWDGPAYPAPEREAGLIAASAQADLYATAALAHELLNGRPPRLDLAGIGEGPVAEVLGRALDPVPGHRHPSATAFRASLMAAADQSLGRGWESRGPGVPTSPPRRGRRPRALPAGLLAFVIATAAAAILVARGGFGPGPYRGPLIVGDDVEVTVTPSRGGCNTTFHIEARGSLRGAGTLQYRWERNDGLETPDTSLAISSDEGAFDLTQAWRLQGGRQFNGTITFQLLRPLQRSVQRSFVYSCS